ncbi:cell wall protein DAN4-like [Colias croceus]|uniref:cell wall protein DAN4-like n=1 Tax=Colias crocea TaxID=72248 RepID=UPI001E27DC41|nr:cell wall protein DAN4-like [Colias croceus]
MASLRLLLLLTIVVQIVLARRINLCRGSTHNAISHPTDCRRYIMCYKFRPYVFICPFKLYFDPDTNNCQPWKSPKCHKPKPPIIPKPSTLPCKQTTPPPTTTTLPTTTTDSTTTTTKPQIEFRIAAEESSLESTKTKHIFSSTHPSKSTLQRIAPTPKTTTKQHSGSTTENIFLKSVHHDALKQSTSSMKTENLPELSKSASKYSTSSKIPVLSKHPNNLLSTASPRSSHNSNHLHLIPVSPIITLCAAEKKN